MQLKEQIFQQLLHTNITFSHENSSKPRKTRNCKTQLKHRNNAIIHTKTQFQHICKPQNNKLNKQRSCVFSNSRSPVFFGIILVVLFTSRASSGYSSATSDIECGFTFFCDFLIQADLLLSVVICRLPARIIDGIPAHGLKSRRDSSALIVRRLALNLEPRFRLQARFQAN